MKLTGVDEKEAFKRLQNLASEKNQKLIDAAQSILAIEKAVTPRG
jgi:AmiR/NasT family two-component response regulator